MLKIPSSPKNNSDLETIFDRTIRKKLILKNNLNLVSFFESNDKNSLESEKIIF